MIRRIGSVLGRDVKSSMRDQMILYTLLAPLMVALVMRAFIPAVGNTTINLIVPADLDPAMIEALRDYGQVEIVTDLAAVEARVLGWDDAAGIVRHGQSYQVILEGNEGEETAVLPGLILEDILGAEYVTVAHRDLGRTTSPLRPLFSALMPLMGVLIGGLVIGLNIIEEKENNMASALGTTPLGRVEYIGGRSLLAIMIAILIAGSTLLAMGTWPFNVGQVLVITLAGTVSAVLVGLYVGGVASTQIEGIGVLKLVALPFMIVPVIAWMLPQQWHPTLYWMPTYWMTMAFRNTFEPGGTWAEVLRLTGIGLAVSLVIMAATYRMIRRRLVLRG